MKDAARALEMRDVTGKYVLPDAHRRELRKKIAEEQNKPEGDRKRVTYSRARACCCKNCHAAPCPENRASAPQSPLGVNRDKNGSVNILISCLTLLCTGKLRYRWRHNSQQAPVLALEPLAPESNETTTGVGGLQEGLRDGGDSEWTVTHY